MSGNTPSAVFGSSFCKTVSVSFTRYQTACPRFPAPLRSPCRASGRTPASSAANASSFAHGLSTGSSFADTAQQSIISIPLSIAAKRRCLTMALLTLPFLLDKIRRCVFIEYLLSIVLPIIKYFIWSYLRAHVLPFFFIFISVSSKKTTMILAILFSTFSSSAPL